MTMILVTHEMSFARDVSSRVVFMDAGRVAVEGTPQDVFGGPGAARAVAEFPRPHRTERVLTGRTARIFPRDNLIFASAKNSVMMANVQR